MNDLPSSLFKYFPPERIDGLAACEMAFSPISAFNDPFEGSPEITALSSHDLMREQIVKLFDEKKKGEIYAQVPENIRSLLSREQFDELAEQYFQRELDQQLEKHKPIFDRLAQSVPRQLEDILGVLCLCEVRDSLLMWGHYGRSHTGLVIEYHADHPYFHAPRSENDEFGHLRRVVYRSARPSGTLMDMDGQSLFLTKSDHWDYEKEWRMLKPLSSADRTMQVNDSTVYLYKYPPEIIKSVIVGARGSAGTIAAVRAILGSNPGYKNVRLLQAYPDPSHFLLKFRELGGGG